jgi:hypothetical protein
MRRGDETLLLDLRLPHWYGTCAASNPDYGTWLVENIANSPDIIPQANAIGQPVLVVIAEKDAIMQNSIIEKFYNLLPNPFNEFRKTGAQDHFHQGWWDVITGKTLEFFSRHI